jgi:Alpha/beta hydrolase domain
MKRSLRALAVVFALVAVVPGGAPALQSAVAATASVPNPTVSGPIASTSALGDPAHGYPFLASEIDLASEGYVEEEYFVAGFARRYTTPPLATGEEIAGGGPYLTRLVVRRPADAKDFNGTVAVEWLNVTAQYDLEIDWFESNEHFMRRGWAWVGVSAQRVGVNALRAWSDRYSSLDGTVTPGDPMAFDVFAQAVQAVRSPVGVAPLGDLQAERVIATGHSQSAGRLATYYNSIHPLHGVVDGFVIHGSGSALRTDLDTKVMRVLAETDVGSQSTEPDNDHFRRWETSGTSHVGFKESEEYTPLVIRDRGSVAPRDCARPPFSRVPFHYVLNAAYHNLERWLQGGPAPSVAPRLEWTAPNTKARDEHGNALGGIRLSQHEVATATNTGSNAGPGFCILFGSHEPFDAATLAALYRSHGAYVSAVEHVTNANLAAGFIVTEDAQETKREAAHSDIGKH